MMLTFEKDNNKFNYRAAGIVIHNGKVMFQKVVGENYWFLPGGRVEFSEEVGEAIEREMHEEYGVSGVHKKLIWFVESFFELNDVKFHEIGTYFYMKLPSTHPIMNLKGEFTGAEEGYVHRWIDLNELHTYNVKPAFLIEELKAVDENSTIKHIVRKG